MLENMNTTHEHMKQLTRYLLLLTFCKEKGSIASRHLKSLKRESFPDHINALKFIFRNFMKPSFLICLVSLFLVLKIK